MKIRKNLLLVVLIAFIVGILGFSLTSLSVAQVSDSDISTAIQKRLSSDWGVETELEVETKNGIVKLSGVVGNILANERAVEIAKSTKGVRAVVDLVHVSVSDRADAEIQKDVINALEQALFMAQYETTLFAKHLPQHIRIQVARNALEASSRHDSFRAPSFKPGEIPNLQEFRCDIFTRAERDYLYDLVRRTGQNIAAACSLAGLSRSRLYSLLKKHQISFH